MPKSTRRGVRPYLRTLITRTHAALANTDAQLAALTQHVTAIDKTGSATPAEQAAIAECLAEAANHGTAVLAAALTIGAAGGRTTALNTEIADRRIGPAARAAADAAALAARTIRRGRNAAAREAAGKTDHQA